MSQNPTPRPNLFHFATSELSQDAILAWLLAWAAPQQQANDPELHVLAQDFVRRLLKVGDDFPIHSVKVLLQWNKVDVAAEVNDNYFLLIEDKTSTREHSDQLNRYIEIAKHHYPDREIIPIYFKLEEQSDLSQVKKAGYRHFRREELLACLAGYFEASTPACPNHILTDFHQYVSSLDESINSFKTLPLNQWKGYSWHGFFAWLQEQIMPAQETDPDSFCGWGYVANPTGGFMGFWWWPKKGSPFYLQLEQEKLTFRMNAEEIEDRAEARRRYRDVLMERARPAYELVNYGRTGNSMGLARLEKAYLKLDAEGHVDLAGTLAVVREMGGILEGI